MAVIQGKGLVSPCSQWFEDVGGHLNVKIRQSNYRSGLDRLAGFLESEAPAFQDNWRIKVVR